MVEHRALKFQRDDAVLRITLADSAQRNTQTPTMWQALAQTAAELDPEVRVVIIDAEGADFSAGLHLDMLRVDGMPGEPPLFKIARDSADALAAEVKEFQKAFTSWRNSHAVVIAAVQGHAIGAGFQLALGADLRLVSEDVKFAMREVGHGLVPDLGGTAVLTHIVGYSRAMEICLTGRFVEAQEAVGSGLATLAAPKAKLAETTDQVVAALLESPAPAMREMKALLAAAVDNPVSEQVALERAAQGRLLHRIAGGN